ncbi:MAG: HTH domain-containing protein, partial [Candidatus Aenigmarchaeota archaeon]|nr:HTH domain-containing protein [Candidatus Aenigmarchaeota archaeon]
MDIEKKIIRILKKDREGITILDMANKLKVHRHTLTKYIYRLQGEGKIKIREIGRAKLCYLNFENKNKKGISNSAIVILTSMLILLSIYSYLSFTGYFLYRETIAPFNISANIPLSLITEKDNNFLELYFENETSFTADFLVDNNGTYNLSLITKFTTPLHLR